MSRHSEELRADCAALRRHCAVLKDHQQILMEQFATQREWYYREKQEFALRVDATAASNSETGFEQEE